MLHILAWETRRERETDTLSWFPHQLTMPTPSARDRIAASINNLAAALDNPTPNSPLPAFETSQVAALKELVRLFSAQPEDEHAPDNGTTTTDPAPTDPTTAAPDSPRLRVEDGPPGGSCRRQSHIAMPPSAAHAPNRPAAPR